MQLNSFITAWSPCHCIRILSLILINLYMFIVEIEYIVLPYWNLDDSKFTIANFGHPDSKSWLRPWLRNLKRFKKTFDGELLVALWLTLLCQILPKYAFACKIISKFTCTNHQLLVTVSCGQVVWDLIPIMLVFIHKFTGISDCYSGLKIFST